MSYPDMRPFETSFARMGGFADARSQLEIEFSRRSDELRMAIFDVIAKAVRLNVQAPTWAYYTLEPKFANPEDHQEVERSMVVMSYPHPRRPNDIATVRIIANEIVLGNPASWLISEDFIIDSYGNTQYAPQSAMLTRESIHASRVPLINFSEAGELKLSSLSALPRPVVVDDELLELPSVFPYGDFARIESSVESLDHGHSLLDEIATTYPVKTS
jgi:hypothetical protein